MKFFKKAIIFLAILAIAGFAYWYFDLKKGKEKEQKEQKEALLFEETERDIVRITIKTEGEAEIIMERRKKEPVSDDKSDDEETWDIASPVNTLGDRYAIDALINSLREAKREEVVWENLEKEAEYNLDKPQHSLRFYYEGDTSPHGIDFGIESLDRLKVFVRIVGKDKIYSVPVGFRNTIIKNLFDVRDKSLAKFTFDDVEEITFISTSGAFFIKREGEEWFLMPNKVRASRTRTELYIGNIVYGHIVQVEEEKGENYQKYGLDKTPVIVNFKLKDDTNYMFIVGERIEQGGTEYFYATRTTDNMIFQVKAETVYGFLKSEFEMKDRKIFDFNDDEVKAVVLKKGANSFSFLKDEQEDWIFEDTGEKLQLGYRIDSLVRGIKNAEYEVREPLKREDGEWNETSIADPAYYVTLKFEDTRSPIMVQLTEKDDETSMLWLSPDNGDTVYFTSGYFLSNFPETREDLL
ncbi:MAG: DUF4340 domain-containing protein [Spirochaetota bacterium]|nr:MAG: DUF4340 domain-containing protein [Spirochaetota bacterium]